MDGILETAVIKDEQVGRAEGPEGTVGGVAHSGLSHGLEAVVGVAQTHSMAGASGRVVKLDFPRFKRRKQGNLQVGGTE